MLFGLYVGSTFYVWFTTIKDQIEMDKRLKEEGYVYKIKKFDKTDFPLLAISALAMSIPIFNLVLPLSTMDKERLYDEYKNRLLEAGSIEKIEDKDKVNKVYEEIKKPIEITHQYKPENKQDNIIDTKDNGYTYKKK